MRSLLPCRYYQHNEIGKVELYQTLRKMDKIPKLDGGGHVEHHAETYDDMQLKVDDEAWMRSAPAQVRGPRISVCSDGSIAGVLFRVR